MKRRARGGRALAATLMALSLFAGGTARSQSEDAAATASEIRREFLHCWNSYKAYAWGHDELRPLSRTAADWYGVSFLMTPVDALDTMILMGLREEADSTREYIATHLSFDRDVEVKNFEFTIRMLGGLLSSYGLTGDRRLLSLAEDLGRRLLPAFRSPTGMPFVFVNLRTGAVRGDTSNPAEVGTLLLEFGTLTRLTGDSSYARAARSALLRMYALRSSRGLVGQGIDVRTGRWTDEDSHVGGRIDSYYEYMLKGARLFGDPACGRMWKTSISAINTWLADSAASGYWYGHANMVTGKRTGAVFGSLDAFFPGLLALSGDTARAARLEQACFSVWTRFGIEPEEWDYRTMTVLDPAYHLRPEIMESAYYLYHATGNPLYRKMGRAFLDSLRTYCRTDAGYAELRSVITKEKSDRMESFFLAETLKYLYLLFAPAGTLKFENVTFNTEAHPLER